MAPSSFNPVEIRVTAGQKTANHALDTQLSNTLLGSGNLGPDVMLRIFMSLNSQIDLEIKWALQTTCQLLMSSPNLIDFEKLPFLGHELIKYFVKPFISHGNEANSKPVVYTDIVQELEFSLDSLLALRNAAQDLVNQQWLSSVPGLKKNIVLTLKQLLHSAFQGSNPEFSSNSGNSISLLLQKAHHNQYKEGFSYLLDLIEVLSCYYIEGTKADPLFNVLVTILTNLKDKHVVVTSLRSLAHLLIVRNSTTQQAAAASSTSGNDDEPPATNCIENVSSGLLLHIVSFLMIDVPDLVAASVDFLRAYLTLTALHPDHPDSVIELQRTRAIELCRNPEVFKILSFQLPNLALVGLPLSEPSNIPLGSIETLVQRNPYGSMPLMVPELPQQLYDIIVKFPEPLRATTWLRCCYEPVSLDRESLPNDNIARTTEVPGEVTQISLWKSYEKQFDKVWSIKEGQTTPLHGNYPKLLPAVDFIKNVNAAFPHSQAMVLNIPLEIPGEAPKRRFIIRGIQARQFVVGADVGNYEALKKQTNDNGFVKQPIRSDLPIGSINDTLFQQGLTGHIQYIESFGRNMSPTLLLTTNYVAIELVEYLMEAVFEKDKELSGTFKNEISWMKDLLYANPGLITSGVLGEKWLEYV